VAAAASDCTTCGTYMTPSLNAGVEPNILSGRVGRSDPAETFQIYAHRSTGQDRAAANLLGQLIEQPA
jgi:hypothetical protein